MEQIVQILIYIHAGFGGLALLCGALALISKKGSSLHKKSGNLFFYTMLSSAITAMVIALMPNHKSVFLLLVGVFSSYFIITGYRALRFKNSNTNPKTDKIISLMMIVTSVIMIVFSFFLYSSFNIVLTVFGSVGLFLSVRDFRLYADKESLNKNWLRLHLGNMIGGYITAVTAFVVVNKVFPSFYGWFIPGVLGGAYIFYTLRKMN